MSVQAAVLITVLLLVGSGFFVASEFALVAAKHHRLEQARAEGARGAQAALAGMHELSLMLAGAQLGITACTLGLGSISEPAIAHQVDPLLHELGLPGGLSYGLAFLVAMTVVVFLHMVVGEMAPKSWAISHPERSAMLLAPPFRALVRAVRPLIRVLNEISNALVRACRVTPREELVPVHDREQLTHLVAESQRLGLISETDSGLITRSLTEPQAPVGAAQVPASRIAEVAADAGTDAILAAAAASDHTRLLVRDGQRVLGSVHARDAVVARAAGRRVTARELARPVPELTPEDTVAHAVEQLRQQRASLAVVRGADGRVTGLISLDDLLVRLMGPAGPRARPAAPVPAAGGPGR
ncbi:hemolysin family protein [Streptomyces sp. MP131-18]|uniref:hemolysin family protein n=1 Tax=Streptomyces sp. MP131-18 TaxID=1857892 RepID=UPI00097BD1C0|nr:hemolysin family protein [Streptomyces sp. MP131-18]ONK12718.1 gliding motility-associated protein GldE [Streptomyces sp. MP131-18]